MTEGRNLGASDPKRLWERSFIAFFLGVVVAVVVGTISALSWLEQFVDQRIENAKIVGKPGPKGEQGPRGEAGPPGEPGKDASLLSGAGVPHGAVIAFDSREGCPAEWSVYEPATSRVIVGAGHQFHPKHRKWRLELPSGGEIPQDLPVYEPQESGGELKHQLSESEMPSHGHITRGSNTGGQTYSGIGKGTVRASTDDHVPVVSEAAGSSEPHNNMPPYVALYLCSRN